LSGQQPRRAHGPSAYATASVASNNFTTIFNAASAAMAGGDKSVVLVKGPQNSWLFWNTDGNPQTPDEAVRLNGLTIASAFQRTDII
jgi:hypothetical protein